MKPLLQFMWKRSLLSFKLTAEQVAVLLDCVSRGAAHPHVGFCDQDFTIDQVKAGLSKLVVRAEILESALWSANMLDEIGRFSPQYTLTFDEFLSSVLPSKFIYDKFFNLIGVRHAE